MGSIAETIFILALRQSMSIRRVAVLLLLAAIPLVIAITSNLLNTDWDGEVAQGFIQGLIFNTGLPLFALIVAAPVFADEIEDRTLTNLMLSPIARWQISIPRCSPPQPSSLSHWPSAHSSRYSSYLKTKPTPPPSSEHSEYSSAPSHSSHYSHSSAPSQRVPSSSESSTSSASKP